MPAKKSYNLQDLTPMSRLIIRQHPTVFANWHPYIGLPVMIRSIGKDYPATWNGYYELGTGEAIHSIGYWVGDRWSHGMLSSGETLLTTVPSFQEWKQYRAIIERK